jgi:hypothetical protein
MDQRTAKPAVTEEVAAAVGGSRSKALLALGIAVSAVCFWFVGRLFHVPRYAGFSGSLLAEPGWLVGLIVVSVTLLVAVLLATLIAGTIRFDAGLFCAAAGMVALSGRGGRMGDVLRGSAATTAGTPTVFVVLAVELVVLYAIVSIAWSVLWGLHKNGYLKADEFRDGVEDTDEPSIFKASALAMQIGVMTLVLLLLGQTDAKVQAVAAVSVSSFAGACAGYYLYPISPSPWLWIGPLFVGTAGYVLAYFGLGAGDDAWRSGQLAHALAPLARPLPLDYATAGPAAAILGYWMSRKWHRQRMTEAAVAATATPGAGTSGDGPAGASSGPGSASVG